MKAALASKGAAIPITPSPSGVLQRECACDGKMDGGLCPECEEEKRRGVLQRSATRGGEVGELPPIVYEVLREPGQPLGAAAREFFEPRFGADFTGVRVSGQGTGLQTKLTLGAPGDHLEREADRTAERVVAAQPGGSRAEYLDLSAVRVHTGPRAATAATAVGARAFTVGRDVVLGDGQYAPGTPAGDRLMAHELTHVLQQAGGAIPLTTAAPAVRRQCVETPCPPISVPVTALYPNYLAAERCIQETYARDHPHSRRNVSLSFNAEWLFIRGGTPNELAALRCLRGEGRGANFTGPSGMFPGEPDIWDFNNTTMYEITTPSGFPERAIRLVNEVAQATAITSTMDCGGLSFSPGTWMPRGPCYFLGNDFYLTVFNQAGVLVYQIIKDAAKEAALAAMLAMLAAMAKKGGMQGGLRTAAVAGGRRLVPAYAIASLTAGIVLLASGRAEAKLGPGTEEPIVQLFEALAQKGTPVPPEVQAMIRDTPGLQEKLNAAMKGGGDPTKAQEDLNKQILQVLAENKDQFTAEELEQILAVTGAAGTSLPQGDVTREQIKQMLTTKARGGTGGGAIETDPKQAEPSTKPAGAEKGARPGEGGISSPPGAGLPAAAARVVNELVQKGGRGPKVDAASLQELREIVAGVIPPLSDAEATALIQKIGSAEGKTVAEVLESVRQGVKAVTTARETATGPADKTPAGEAGSAAKGGEKDREGGGSGTIPAPIDPVKDKKPKPTQQDREEGPAFGDILAKGAYDFLKPGEAGLLYDKGLVFKKNQRVSGFIVARGTDGQLVMGRAQWTPREVTGDRKWTMSLHGGSRLYGANGSVRAVTRTETVTVIPH